MHFVMCNIAEGNSNSNCGAIIKQIYNYVPLARLSQKCVDAPFVKQHFS
jgi:hypothetical protein